MNSPPNIARSLQWIVAAIVLCCLSVGCGPSSSASHASSSSPDRDTATYPGSYPINVVCTTAQVADIISNVGGEHVRAENLMGPGVDPHLYQATPSDVTKLNGADIIFFNGLHLEGRLADLLVRFARRKPAFAVSEGLQEAADPRLREPAEFQGHYDPHIWHDASLWSDCVRYAAQQLAEFDPSHADEYRANAERYIEQLTKAHEQFKSRLAEIPPERRVLVTAHDAFGYFGKAYDVEVHGLQGISTVSEANVATMQNTVELLVNRKIKAVFVETSVSPRNVQALIEACVARGHQVSIGGSLYSDAMGQPGTPEGTYLGMLRHNVETIVKALK